MSVCKQRHVQLYVHSGVKNVVSEDVFNSKKEAAKRGRKPKSSGPSEFCSIILCACSFAIRLGNLDKTSYIVHICREFIPKGSYGVALINYNERDTCSSA